MKLLYDLAGIYQARSPVHGGGVYAKSLLSEILNLDDAGRRGAEITALVSPDLDARDPQLARLLDSADVTRQELRDAGELSTVLAAGRGWDAYYTALPYDLPDRLRPKDAGRIPVIGTVHGLRDFDLVFDRHYRSYLRNPAVRARMFFRNYARGSYLRGVRQQFAELFQLLGGNLITVSNHTKYQLLVEFPQLSPDRIEVIPPLSEQSEGDGAANDSTSVSAHGLEPGSYLLLLSCDRPVKNAVRVFEALETKRVPGAGDLQLACVGFRPYQIAAVRRWYPRTSSHTVFIPYVGREELDALFAGAFAFLYPSISEGFGYPPLEAMRAGTPVIASPHTAISEVCADAVLYANPYSTSEIAARLARLLAEPELREELVRRGRLRSAEYETARAERAGRFLDFVRRIAGYAGGPGTG